MYKKLFKKIYIVYIKKIKKYIRLKSGPYVSGDAIRSITDHKLDESKSFIPQKVKKNDLVFVKTDYVDQFFKNYYKNIENKFILITHNSDINISKKYLNLDLEKIIVWFGQNISFLIKDTPKFEILPIGIENRSWFKNGKISNFKIRNYKKNKLIFLG